MLRVIKLLKEREKYYRELKLDYSINGSNSLSNKCESLENEYSAAIKILNEAIRPEG